MANTITDPNMGFQNPVVDVDPGPDYASNVSLALTTIGAHNHSSGNGVKVTPSGLLISTDLSFISNNALDLRSVRFTPQSMPLAGIADINCGYFSGVDFWVNDGLGNQIRITESGGVAGSPGSISNLTSPASAAYVSGTQTFVWQSDVNTAANMDNGSITIREVAANAKGITLSSPASLAADYSLTFLSALPGSTSFLTVDNAGNLGTSSVTGLFPVSTANIADHAVTQVKLELKSSGITVGAGGVALSIAFSTIITTNTNPIGGVSVTLTTTGRPVRLFLQSDSSGTTSNISLNGTNPNGLIYVNNGGTLFSSFELGGGGLGAVSLFYAPSIIDVLDMSVNGVPGTYTYTIGANPAAGNISFNNVLIVAYEI